MTSSPVARTELSIGEALEALKVEFPDITISKIRFFEGQGLIEPERTPSGYRKFTHVDVERLRWVLRQQHEAYLPLKVIRDRLAHAEEAGTVPRTLPRITSTRRLPAPSGGFAGGLDDDLDDGGDEFEADDDFDELEAPFAPGIPTVGAGSEASPETPESLGEFRHPASRSRSAGLRPDLLPVRDPASVQDVSSSKVRPSQLPSSPSNSAATTPPRASSAGEGEGNTPRGQLASPGLEGESGLLQVPRSSKDAAPPKSNATDESKSPLGAKNPMLGTSGGAPRSFAELASASGLSLEDLRLIEEFGLISGRQVFDGRFYDDEALQVAQTVLAFRAFGIEPRHLRMYKTAADREASFFAQIVAPLLHKRGGDGRGQAAEMLEELRALGEALRGATLRQALRDVLDGR